MISNKNFIDGEIYEHENGNVFLWDASIKGSNYYLGNSKTEFLKGLAFQRQNAVCVASKEDKLWLKACISADETVPFEAIKQHINNKNQTYEIY